MTSSGSQYASAKPYARLAIRLEELPDLGTQTRTLGVTLAMRIRFRPLAYPLSQKRSHNA